MGNALFCSCLHKIQLLVLLMDSFKVKVSSPSSILDNRCLVKLVRFSFEDNYVYHGVSDQPKRAVPGSMNLLGYMGTE